MKILAVGDIVGENGLNISAKSSDGCTSLQISYEEPKNLAKEEAEDFKEFLESGPDLNTCEYFLPTILDHMMKDGLEVKVLPTTAVWKGVTYKEDVEELKAHIRECIENGEYPENLWG